MGVVAGGCCAGGGSGSCVFQRVHVPRVRGTSPSCHPSLIIGNPFNFNLVTIRFYAKSRPKQLSLIHGCLVTHLQSQDVSSSCCSLEAWWVLDMRVPSPTAEHVSFVTLKF